MNKRLFVVFSLLLLFCYPVSTLAIESVKVGIYQNKPKVFIDDQSGKPKGIFIDILEDIASKEGWQLEYLSASWDTNLNRLEQGEVDLLLDIADSERREALFDYNKEIIFSNWAIVYVQEESEIESIIDLKNKKVAAMKGDISYADFKNKIADLGIYCTFVEVDEFSDVFELVDQKKVDAGIISRLFGLSNENAYKAKRSNIICCPNNLYFAVPKNTNKYLLERIDHHLYELKKDEQSIYYKSIMRWIEGISPWKFPVWLKWFIALFGVFLFMCMVGIAILKKQVTARTVELRDANCELKGTQFDLISKNESLNAEIEERKHMEEEKDLLQRQLIQSQKMEAIGVLAGGIAHDFNNLLYVISGNTELLIDNARPEDHELLQEIFQSTQRGADLVKQLLIFSHRVESNFQITHLNTELKRIIIMLERTIQKMIEIQLDLTDDLYNINADSSQLEQVVLNLCINARDSMPNGGKLLIKTENDIVDDFFQATHSQLEKGRCVILTISDTGYGMDGETREHIFEPFYTTKELGKGTGLGLAVVYGIIKAHQGHISCYSEVGTGTTFRIYLPAAEGLSTYPKEDKDSSIAPRGSETILIVDDDKSVVKLTKSMLERLGYKTIEAESGESALDIYYENQHEIDLILLDIGMPGIGGNKCLERLIDFNPHVKVIVSSGYAMIDFIDNAMNFGARDYMVKPYTKRALSETIRSVLDEIAG